MELIGLVEASYDVTELDKQFAYRMLDLFAYCIRVQDGDIKRASELQEIAYQGLKAHRIEGDASVLRKALCMLSDDYGLTGRPAMAENVLKRELQDPSLPWKKKADLQGYALIRKKLRYWQRRNPNGGR